MSCYQVCVLTTNGKTIVVDIPSRSVTASALKALIEEKEDIPPTYQQLTCNGKSLHGDTLVSVGATITLTVF